MASTGLDLLNSSSFVQQISEEITVKSTLGVGTICRFNITRSLAQATAKTRQTIKQVIRLELNQQYCILVADHELASRQLLVNLLTSGGFQVREAINGQVAVALWHSWQPQLIWMDIQMPIMDGYKAIKQIRSAES